MIVLVPCGDGVREMTPAQVVDLILRQRRQIAELKTDCEWLKEENKRLLCDWFRWRKAEAARPKKLAKAQRAQRRLARKPVVVRRRRRIEA